MKTIFSLKTATFSGMYDALRGVLTTTGRDGARPVSTTTMMTAGSLLKRLRVETRHATSLQPLRSKYDRIYPKPHNGTITISGTGAD